MRGIEIRAYTASDGTPMVAYNVNPKTTRTAAELSVSMDYFQTRLNKRVAAYSMVNPNTDPAPPKGAKPRSGKVKSLIEGGGGAAGVVCTFDDVGGIDCIGGEGGDPPDSGGGSTGGGTDAWEYDWQPDEQYDTPVVVVVGEAPPPPPPPPPYPGGSGADRGDADPCLAPDGSNLCQQVIIKASLPVAPQGCIFTPVGRVCNITPPIVIDPFSPPPPPKEAPWFPQSACNTMHILCSAGQTPEDNERVEPTGDTYADALEACYNNREVEENMCFANKNMGVLDQRGLHACLQKARARHSQCMTTARREHRIGGYAL